MKKKLFVIMALIAAMIGTQGLFADVKPLNFSLQGGVVTDDSFSFKPFLWTAGVTLDFHFGEMLMFSPECFIIAHGFKFDYFFLAPAAILNIKLSNFFVGGGITKWFLIGDENAWSTDVALKLNAGLRTGNTRLTAFIITDFDNLFKDMVVGATLGFGF